MARNVRSLDRTLRVLVGVTLVGAAVLGFISPIGYVGIIPLATGLIGYCPVYRLFGRRP